MVLMVDGPPPLTILSPGPSNASSTTTTTPMTFINLTEESSLDGLPPLVMSNATSTSTSILPTPMQTDTSDAATEPEPDPEVVPISNSSSRAKRYQCPACPYVTDSKTQFAYHKSFHRPRGDPYQCSECSYNVTKKHLLIQHQKTHTAPVSEPSRELSLVSSKETKSSGLTPVELLNLTKKMGTEVSIIPAITATNPTNPTKGQLVPKILYYCANCPARYLDESEIVIHQNKHHQHDKYKCDLCSFSTCDESGIANHRNVHGLNYRTTTAELRRHNVESERHSRPKIISIRSGDDQPEKVWVVKKDHEALQPTEQEEPIIIDDLILVEDGVPAEDSIVIDDTVPVDEPMQIEYPVLVIEEPVQEEDPVIAPEEPTPKPPTPGPEKRKSSKPKEPPRVRRSTRVKQRTAQEQPPAKTNRRSKQPPESYSCDHCDYTNADEQALKDHVAFHLRDVLFPPSVDDYAEHRGTLRRKSTRANDDEADRDGEEEGDKIFLDLRKLRS